MYEIKTPSQSEKGVTRRDFLTMLGLAATGAAAYSNRDYLQKQLSNFLAESRYLEVLKYNGEVLIGYQGNIYKIDEYKHTKPSRGMDALIRSTYPTFDNSQVKVYSDIAEQLHLSKKAWKDLKEGEIIKIPYDRKGLKQPNRFDEYPIPKKIGSGSLEQVIAKSEIK